MTQTVTDTAPDEVEQATPPEPLRHLVCPCQVPLTEGHAHCGVRVKAGPAESRRRFKPMEICVICQDHASEGTPCKFCGKNA